MKSRRKVFSSGMHSSYLRTRVLRAVMRDILLEFTSPRRCRDDNCTHRPSQITSAPVDTLRRALLCLETENATTIAINTRKVYAALSRSPAHEIVPLCRTQIVSFLCAGNSGPPFRE